MAKQQSAKGPRLDAINVHVGAKLRAARETRNESETAAADAIGVSVKQYAAIERGEERLTAEQMYRLSKRLGTSVNHFFEGLPYLY